jgi:hypothetical protein
MSLAVMGRTAIFDFSVSAQAPAPPRITLLIPLGAVPFLLAVALLLLLLPPPARLEPMRRRRAAEAADPAAERNAIGTGRWLCWPEADLMNILTNHTSPSFRAPSARYTADRSMLSVNGTNFNG